MGQSLKWFLALAMLLSLFGCVAETGAGPEAEVQPAPESQHQTAQPPELPEETSEAPEETPEPPEETSEAPEETPEAPEETPREDFEPYEAPPFADSSFHSDAAQGENGALLDLSAVSEGYVGASAQRERRLKFQVIKGESTYTYNLPSDGTPAIFPLQGGDGAYLFRVMEEVRDSKYTKVFVTGADVVLKDEFQPFLRPSQYVPYGADSACVQKAAEIAATQSDALGVVEAVFEYICDNVTYDHELAQSVEKSYLPDPDRTLQSGKGICFDYASLAAAMLRSQGIPAKLVFGFVQPNNLYHAWNLFYTEESGWVAMQYQVESNTWNRLDPTFAANGTDAEYIGDGTNYADVYYY